MKKLVGLLGLILSISGFGDHININQCGYRITQPGEYRLSASLDCSDLQNPRAITILNTSNVVLNLRGRDLKGNGGVGIGVVNSNNVSILGGAFSADIEDFAAGINLNNSSYVTVDGANLELKNNGIGVGVYGGQENTIRRVRILDSSLQDVIFQKTKVVRLENSRLRGTSPKGILVNYSKYVHIEDNRIGRRDKVDLGIIFYQSYFATVRNNKLDQADVAIVLQGQETQGIRLEQNEFGDRYRNTCDYRVLNNAAQPILVTNQPNSLVVCP